MAVDSSPLNSAVLAELTSWLPRLPRSPGGFEQDTYTDLATFPIYVGGVRFFPVCTAFNLAPRGNQTVTGWQKDMGGGTWAGYDLKGNFKGSWYADNSWQQFFEAATLPAIAYGVHLAGVGAVAAGTGDAFLPGALGVDGASAYATSEAAAFASSIAPWAAPAGAAAVSTVTPIGAASTAASVAGPLVKGAASLAAGAAAMTAKPGSVNPVTGQQTPYVTQPGSTLGGLPIGLILAAGAALLAFS